jgi:predicted RNA-binding Zn-ribbon protein involved in translation (DUF1610 family)
VIARVTCPDCGDIALGVECLSVVRGLEADRFQFLCPRCGRQVDKQTDPHVGTLLLTAGARVAPRRPTSLEMAEFRAELDGEGWLDRLLAAPPFDPMG